MKLTEKQRRFCDYYIETLNATQSYKLAGYSASSDEVAGINGHRLLKSDKVNTFIRDRLSEKETERIASQDEVLEFLTAVQRGVIREKKPVDLQTRVRASELLGKRHGLFNDKLIEIRNTNIQQDVEYVAEWSED